MTGPVPAAPRGRRARPAASRLPARPARARRPTAPAPPRPARRGPAPPLGPAAGTFKHGADAAPAPSRSPALPPRTPRSESAGSSREQRCRRPPARARPKRGTAPGVDLNSTRGAATGGWGGRGSQSAPALLPARPMGARRCAASPSSSRLPLPGERRRVSGRGFGGFPPSLPPCLPPAPTASASRAGAGGGRRAV